MAKSDTDRLDELEILAAHQARLLEDLNETVVRQDKQVHRLEHILEALIDDEKSVAEIVDMGFDRDTVKRVERLIYLAEYKRFQSAPGVKLTDRAFWLDRRYPIVNKWQDRS